MLMVCICWVQPSGALLWRFRYRCCGIERKLSLVAPRADPALTGGNVDVRQVAGLIDELRTRYPNALLNDDERRRLRGALYLPLLELGDADRTRIVDAIMRKLLS